MRETRELESVKPILPLVLRFHYDIVDSTNSEARRLAEAHPCQPFLVTAASQSQGRGRHGREWQSPVGGAWMSIAWPAAQPPSFYSSVSLAVAVAVRRALAQWTVGSEKVLRIKWPNDLLIDEAKVGGILCEQLAAVRGGRPALLVVGIGVNVDFEETLLPARPRHPATTLAAALGRCAPKVEEVTVAIAEEARVSLERYEIAGLDEAALAELTENLAHLGTVQSWSSPKGVVKGTVIGVDARGRLLMEAGGDRITCEVGEFLATTRPIQA